MNWKSEQSPLLTMPGTHRLRSSWRWPAFWLRLLLPAFFVLENAGGADAAGNAVSLPLERAVFTNYAAIASASYQDALTTARKLQDAIHAFVAAPSRESLEAARRAWLAAHRSYSFTEAYRFYNGPIDQVEALVNSWPIDPGYIGAVIGAPESGIINAVSNFPTLSRSLLVSLNGKDGKENISTGFHAIEFLLWGQPPGGRGAGDRSWRDYADGARNVERRRAYLRIVTDLVVEHLQTVADAWAEGNDHDYRARFLAMAPDTALADILMGMGSLSGPELSGERLTIAYETKERDEQQDCFSDNTCADLVADAVGIQNVFLGRYVTLGGRKIDGPGVRDLLEQVNPGFAAKLTAQDADAVAAVRGIPPPFDQAIVGANQSPNRIAMKKAITALQTQSDLIARAAKVLSIQLNL